MNWRVAWLLLLSACGGGEQQLPTESSTDSQPAPAVELELVSFVHENVGWESECVWARFRVENVCDQPLGFLGGSGVEPVVRIKYFSEGRWVEGKPYWIECGTGRSSGILEVAAHAETEAWVRRPDLPVRIGVGVWDGELEDQPPWDTWTWTWSDALVFDEMSSVASAANEDSR